MLKKYIGTKDFYRKVLAISIPIIIQNGITNFVGLLDNIMVGSLSTEAMSGVSIVNQFIFIFYLMVFGAISAAGIFTAQYRGSSDTEGIRSTFRLKIMITLISTALGTVLFFFIGEALIGTFLHSSEGAGDLALTMSYGKKYLAVMLIGLLPYSLSQVYASTMRETGETVTPMIASVIAVGTNFLLNIVLIFGYLGFPALGVVGAAIATVVSRFAEVAILIICGHTNKKKYGFLVGAYRSFKVPLPLLREVIKRGLPLMANEVLWSVSMTLRNQSYSMRGLDAVAAQNIANTLGNVLNVAYMSLGSAVAIIIGNLLGAGRLEEARDENKKLLAFSVMSGAAMGLLMVALSGVFPSLYNTTDSVRSLSTYMILIIALTMPTGAFSHSTYFTLRSGGRVFSTFLFDCGFNWLTIVPVSIILANFTSLSIVPLFAICQCLDMLKCLIAAYLIKKGSWVRRIIV